MYSLSTLILLFALELSCLDEFNFIDHVHYCSQTLVDCDDFVCRLSTSDNYLNDQEEFRNRLRLEAEERKLEETLEYQRWIEEEAKKKHLAEQHRRTSPGSDGSACLRTDVNLNGDQDKHHCAQNNSHTHLEGINFGDFRFSEVPLQEEHSILRSCDSDLLQTKEKNHNEVHNGLGYPGTRPIASSDVDLIKPTVKVNGVWKNVEYTKATLKANGVGKNAENTKVPTIPSTQKSRRSTSQAHKKYIQGCWFVLSKSDILF